MLHVSLGTSIHGSVASEVPSSRELPSNIPTDYVELVMLLSIGCPAELLESRVVRGLLRHLGGGVT